MKITVARIREDDREGARIIYIDVDPDTGEITADGDDAMLGTATSAEDAFERVYGAWSAWGTFCFMALYRDGWEIDSF